MEENKNVEPNSVPQAGQSPSKPVNSKKEKVQEKKKSSVGVVLMILAIVALSGICGFMVFRDQEKTKVIMAKQESIDTLNVLVENQIAELELKKKELIDLQAMANELQIQADSLPILIQEIEALQIDLRKAKGSAWAYKSKYDAYVTKVASIESEIMRITAEKDLALARIDTLTIEKTVLGDTLRAIKQEKTVLAEKVAIASIMKGHDFAVLGYSSKGKEYAGPEFKSKQLEKLKFSFNLAENKIAPQNDKKVVMRLIEPDGTVLFGGTEGGSFNTASGEEKMYSMTQNVSFSGSKQKVTFVYQKGNEYKTGKHTIEVFADGHLLGDASFVVK